MKNLFCLFLLICFLGCSNNKTKLLIISKWDVVQIGEPEKKDTAGIDPVTKVFSEQFARTSAMANAMMLYEINGDAYEFHTNGSCGISMAGVKMSNAPYKVSSDGKTLTLKGTGLSGKDQVYEVLSIDSKQMQLKYSDGEKILLERNTK